MRSRRPTPKPTSEWVAETRLVGRINAGEESAFRQLMESYNQSLYRVARAIVSDDVEAEDVLQESYTRAFAAMSGFRGDSSLGTWLTRIVINESRGRLRRRRTVAQAADALTRLADRLAVVDRLGEGQQLQIVFQPVGDPVEQPRTLGW